MARCGFVTTNIILNQFLCSESICIERHVLVDTD